MLRGSGSARADRSARLGRAQGNIAERAAALALLVVSAPIVALIALFIRLSSGRPIFYRGERLGRGRQLFTMYKLRTLRVGAQQVMGSQLLGDRHELMIRGGRFLRDTRLDELPQLWNIVRGEMSFVGPRPERPEVFEAQCSGIPGYDRRFSVRPGLIGISQLFTPHGTPKRYRTLIDNGVIRRESRGERRLRIVAFTMWIVVSQVTQRSARQFALLRTRLTGRYQEKRRLRRVTPEGAIVRLGRPGTGGVSSRLLDMNSESLLVECASEPWVEKATEFELDIPVRGRTLPARRTARCTGLVLERRVGAGRTRLVIRYQPASPRSEYMIHQYFLRNSLARAPRVWLEAPAPSLPLLHVATAEPLADGHPSLPPERERLQRVSLG